MSALQREAEVEIYFKDNWATTALQIPDASFDTDGLDSYIRYNFINFDNSLVGIQRQHAIGYAQIFCYHEVRKLSLKLADDVKTFFDNKTLPYDIEVGIGIQEPTYELENGMFVTLVQFKVTQFTN